MRGVPHAKQLIQQNTTHDEAFSFFGFCFTSYEVPIRSFQTKRFWLKLKLNNSPTSSKAMGSEKLEKNAFSFTSAVINASQKFVLWIELSVIHL